MGSGVVEYKTVTFVLTSQNLVLILWGLTHPERNHEHGFWTQATSWNIQDCWILCNLNLTQEWPGTGNSASNWVICWNCCGMGLGWHPLNMTVEKKHSNPWQLEKLLTTLGLGGFWTCRKLGEDSILKKLLFPFSFLSRHLMFFGTSCPVPS